MTGSRFLLGFAIVLLVGPGCASDVYERGCPIAPRCQYFEEGTTDYAKVLQALGPPTTLSKLPTGFVFLYEHVVVKEKQIGLSFEQLLGDVGVAQPAPTVNGTAGVTLASLIKLLYAWSNADLETMVMTFDHDGWLQRARYERTNPDLGSTIGVSLIISASRKLGIENYQIEPGQQTWGMRLTDSLPQTLNAQQDLSSGQSGVARLPGYMRVGQDAGALPPPTVTRKEKRKANR